jgi:hypothetical protein
MIEERSYRKYYTIFEILILPDHAKEPGSLWFYAPNKGAPIAFAILFAISGAVHFYQTLYVYDCPSSREVTKIQI